MTVNDYVERHTAFAEKLAWLRKRGLPRHVDVDDLKGAAYLGLVEAANRYREGGPAGFQSYAYHRIMGAIGDYLRTLGDPDLSLVDGEGREIEVAGEKEPDSFEEILGVVASGVGDQEKSILRLYYGGDETMKQIGSRYGVSESRVCQILSACRKKIRENWDDERWDELAA